MNNRIRAFVVDDSGFVVASVTRKLASDPEIEVVGSAHDVKEAIEKIGEITGKKAKIRYEHQPRAGDHIWYISDVTKFKSHYPQWEYHYNGDSILEDLCKNMAVLEARK